MASLHTEVKAMPQAEQRGAAGSVQLTARDVLNRALRRWDVIEADASLPRTTTELISADRLSTPPTGDRATDRWNNNFQWIG